MGEGDCRVGAKQAQPDIDIHDFCSNSRGQAKSYISLPDPDRNVVIRVPGPSPEGAKYPVLGEIGDVELIDRKSDGSIDSYSHGKWTSIIIDARIKNICGSAVASWRQDLVDALYDNLTHRARSADEGDRQTRVTASVEKFEVKKPGISRFKKEFTIVQTTNHPDGSQSVGLVVTGVFGLGGVDLLIREGANVYVDIRGDFSRFANTITERFLDKALEIEAAQK